MKPINTANEKPIFELKGSVLTVIVLHINDTDADRFYPQLKKKIGQTRSFFIRPKCGGRGRTPLEDSRLKFEVIGSFNPSP